jgi:hypothetical protein
MNVIDELGAVMLTVGYEQGEDLIDNVLSCLSFT